MPTPRGKAWDAPSVSRELDRQRKDIEQIRRRMDRAVKTQPPPPSGGGIVGQAEVYASPLTVDVSGGYPNRIDRFNIPWEAPYDPTPLNTDVSGWVWINGSELQLTPGWYSAVFVLTCTWLNPTDAPESFVFMMRGGLDTPHVAYGSIPSMTFDSSIGKGIVDHVVNYGIFYCPGGTTWTIAPELQWSVGGTSVVPTTTGYVCTVTKYAD